MQNNFMNLIHGSVLFAGITTRETEKMLACLNAKQAKYQKNEYILRAGETNGYVLLLLQGGVCIVQEDFWGNRNIISKIVPGDIFAEAFACVPGARLSVSVTAEIKSTVLFLDIGRILTPCGASCPFHGRAVQNLVACLAGKNLHLTEKLTHITQRTTREKLLSFLSAESIRQGASEFNIPYNRQQLADYLSVDRSAMSAELCRLRDEGVLVFHKNRFELLVESGR